MTRMIASVQSLSRDLRALGLAPGDGVFVHASMRAVGPTIGGARAVVEALIAAVGPDGLIGMPGFCDDAYFPTHLDRSAMSRDEVAAAQAAVLGYSPATSSCADMGAIAELFRTWPGVSRSDHPTMSICLRGPDAEMYRAPHALDWATGREAPMGRLSGRPRMKILLIGVDWTRCTALHIAETLAPHRRLKRHSIKTGPGDAPWVDATEVADDLGRLFPKVGAAFEETGAVTHGRLGAADCRLCGYGALVDFATHWIDAANRASGDVA